MRNFYFFGIFFCILFFQCSSDKKNVPDISTSTLKVKFYHFHDELLGTSKEPTENSVLELIKKYPIFFDLFTRHVIRIGGPEFKEFNNYLRSFYNDPMIKTVYTDVNKTFGDLVKQKNTIETAFKYYHSYFPDKKIPEIIFYVSGFNQSLIADEAFLGIGLDKYLGTEYPYYSQLGIPMYQRQKMKPEMMEVEALRTWLEVEFELSDSSENMLNTMIHFGKIQYTLSYIFPETSDSLLFGFSQPQWNWCEENEEKMWTWFLNEKKLFDTDLLEIRRFTSDGPFTTQFSRESPAKTGVWLGWKIVSAYMKKNPTTTIPQLINEPNAQKILTQSGYKP